MDVHLSDGSGIEATRSLVAASPDVRVLVMTMTADDEAVVAAMRAGARGYVVKGAGRNELLQAVRTVAAGGAVFSPAVADRLRAVRARHGRRPRAQRRPRRRRARVGPRRTVRTVDPELASVALDGIVEGTWHGALAAAGPAPDRPEWDALLREAARFTRPATSEDGTLVAVPLVHGGTVLAVLRLAAPQPLDGTTLLAVRSLALAAGGTLHAVQLYGRVLEESRRDALTGLRNRRRFEEDLAQELALTGRHGTPLALLMVDVDHFKAYNDTHGHRQGDRLLQDLGRLLGGTLRSTDTAYRYGGEEFAVLLRGTGAEDAAVLAERVRGVVAGWTDVTVSLGICAVAGRGGRGRLRRGGGRGAVRRQGGRPQHRPHGRGGRGPRAAAAVPARTPETAPSGGGRTARHRCGRGARWVPVRQAAEAAWVTTPCWTRSRTCATRCPRSRSTPARCSSRWPSPTGRGWCACSRSGTAPRRACAATSASASPCSRTTSRCSRVSGSWSVALRGRERSTSCAPTPSRPWPAGWST